MQLGIKKGLGIVVASGHSYDATRIPPTTKPPFRSGHSVVRLEKNVKNMPEQKKTLKFVAAIRV